MLSVTEKGHWKDRIARRIEQRIQTLVAKGDPTLLERAAKMARERAYASLSIERQHREIEEIQKQKEALDRREKRLRAEQRAVVNGTTVEKELERYDNYYARDEVDKAVDVRAKALESDILSECELGRQVAQLREEQENLLDTVWLATSSSQIKELWEKVNALLGVTPTRLEEKALAIAPVQDE